jgi:hypothetical protein
MKKIIAIILLLSLVLVVGCSQQMVCNKPYIQVGNECCLDNNDNNICDSDENQIIEDEPQEVEEPEVETTLPVTEELVVEEKLPVINIQFESMRKMSGGPAGMRGNVFCVKYISHDEYLNKEIEEVALWIDSEENLFELRPYKGSSLNYFNSWTYCDKGNLLYGCTEENCLDNKYTGVHDIGFDVLWTDGASAMFETNLNFEDLNLYCESKADCPYMSDCVNNQCPAQYD